MPNSDSVFGTYNKQTKIFSQFQPVWSPTPEEAWEGWDGNPIPVDLQIFANVDEAKSYFLTADALTVIDDCCTNIQWALVADDNGNNTKLKVTFDFGTKGTPDIAEADDWAGQYNSRKATLQNNNNWVNNGYTVADSSDHLF